MTGIAKTINELSLYFFTEHLNFCFLSLVLKNNNLELLPCFDDKNSITSNFPAQSNNRLKEELLLKDTPEVDFKNYGAHYNLNNGRIPK